MLTPNDLGMTGSHQAGLHIPKDPRVISFFPALDENAENPDCRLEMSSEELGATVSLRFVHYNSRLRGSGTRNEYRLTGTTRLFRDLHAVPGDEVEFDMGTNGNSSVRLLRASALKTKSNETRELSGNWIIEERTEEIG